MKKDALKSVWVLRRDGKGTPSNKIPSAEFYNPSPHTFPTPSTACFKLRDYLRLLAFPFIFLERKVLLRSILPLRDRLASLSLERGCRVVYYHYAF